MISLAVACLISGLGLYLYQALALRLGIIDHPNERSAHRRPTLSGAGIAFPLACGVGALFIESDLSTLLASPVLVLTAAFVVACIGLIDDYRDVSSGIRLVLYAAIAVATVVLESRGYHYLYWILGAIALLWLMNLYNFMDGLDGLAGLQAICTASGMFCLNLLTGEPVPAVGSLSLLLIGCLIPFLWLNWPPAKLFMGDAGAVFLGFVLGIIGLKALQGNPRLGVAWGILMMPFLIDATATLLIRLTRGLPPHIAHSDHLYQRLNRRWQSATRIDHGLVLLHALWQFPLAVFAVMGPYSPLFAVIFSTIPVAVMLVYQRVSA